RQRLVHLDVFDRHVDPLAPGAVEDTTRLRAFPRESRPYEKRRLLPGRSSDLEIAVDGWQEDVRLARIEQLAQPLSGSAKKSRPVEVTGESVPDLTESFELGQAAHGGLVATRVLDRDRGLLREQRQDLSVLAREHLATSLLGHGEPGVWHPTDHDRRDKHG